MVRAIQLFSAPDSLGNRKGSEPDCAGYSRALGGAIRYVAHTCPDPFDQPRRDRVPSQRAHTLISVWRCYKERGIDRKCSEPCRPWGRQSGCLKGRLWPPLSSSRLLQCLQTVLPQRRIGNSINRDVPYKEFWIPLPHTLKHNQRICSRDASPHRQCPPLPRSLNRGQGGRFSRNSSRRYAESHDLFVRFAGSTVPCSAPSSRTASAWDPTTSTTPSRSSRPMAARASTPCSLPERGWVAPRTVLVGVSATTTQVRFCPCALLPPSTRAGQ
jgi:hypothetical protein